MTDPCIAKIREAFIEKVGLIKQNDGLPRTAGRIFGLLMFDGKVTSFADLADELQVSRGSISTATRQLEERGLIKRVGRLGERQDYFQMVDNPYAGMLQNIAAEMTRSKAEIDATLSELCDIDPAARERLVAFSHFYETVSRGVRRSADELDEQTEID